jgi:hypothetical protein
MEKKDEKRQKGKNLGPSHHKGLCLPHSIWQFIPLKNQKKSMAKTKQTGTITRHILLCFVDVFA